MQTQEYERWALSKARCDTDAAHLINAALGLAGESGEFADLVKKTLFHEHRPDAARMLDELGDVLWYVALACSALSSSMDAALRQNMEKLNARYPDGFDAQRSRERRQK